MTMADERTRSLRFGWEFLMELRASDCLTAEQRRTVDEILRHYPTGAEIKQWAKDCEEESPDTAIYGSRLSPENLRSTYVDPQEPVIPDSIERGPTTPQERAYALRSAYEFFRFGLLWDHAHDSQGADGLPRWSNHVRSTAVLQPRSLITKSATQRFSARLHYCDKTV